MHIAQQNYAGRKYQRHKMNAIKMIKNISILIPNKSYNGRLSDSGLRGRRGGIVKRYQKAQRSLAIVLRLTILIGDTFEPRSPKRKELIMVEEKIRLP